ncbi:MAG: NTP transferase domain-containing protein [Candidatus Eisenbacteria sp.]|nr:NTP transferase domain-containing protein [Candidatus Eisenbacteria bacterium]
MSNRETHSEPDRVAIVLAAGEGKRMRSPLPKVLHEIQGVPLAVHVLRAAREVGIERVVMVVGHGKETVRSAIEDDWDCEFVIQPVQRGTADAVNRAMEVLTGFRGTMVVLSGDVPLLRAETIKTMLAEHEGEDRGVTLLTAILEDPTGYGRIVRDAAGTVEAIVEEKDADDEVRAIREFNSGIYCFNTDQLRSVLDSIGADNRQREFYLTDAVHLMKMKGVPVGAVVAETADEVLGVNTPEDLERTRALYRARQAR